MANVYNHDIVGIYNRVNRFVEELVKSVSSGVSQMNAFDQARLLSYLKNISTYLAWVTAQPQLDLPETHPRLYALPEAPEPVTVENEEVDDVVRMLLVARDEIINSQSARQGSGLIPFDASRFLAVVKKCEAFMADYVATVTPLDLPESSPTDPMSGGGKVGV